MNIPISKIILALLVILALYFVITTVIHIVLNPVFWIIAILVVGGWLYMSHKPTQTS